jgi:hypothetical protein
MSAKTEDSATGEFVRVERLPWNRPTLRRLNASQAEHGGGGGPDAGNDMMS